ncbi:hypothetical protein ACMD2_04859 [Ananas comosus]|uniref:Uncharacterized protein n=1 Tax=Ananas comosus TaxID=4615 RepID=A0A199UMN1_ANACO|nr:hypothetical protein ACMD2_04859 [Ananas comosus]
MLGRSAGSSCRQQSATFTTLSTSSSLTLPSSLGSANTLYRLSAWRSSATIGKYSPPPPLPLHEPLDESFESPSVTQSLQQHHPEAVDVGAIRYRRIGEPLRRQVPAGPPHRREEPRLVRAHQFREAEVGDLHLAGVGQQYVLRLDVAVHDLVIAAGVQIREPSCRADGDLHPLSPL